jgi:hypothetical protein
MLCPHNNHLLAASPETVALLGWRDGEAILSVLTQPGVCTDGTTVLLNLWVLMQVLAAHSAAPADQQLSEPEIVLNKQLLQQQRAAVAVEEAQLLSEAPRKSREQEVQAKRLKALCWDAYQVRHNSEARGQHATGNTRTEPQHHLMAGIHALGLHEFTT